MRAATMKERPSFPLMRQTDVQSIYHMQMPRWLFSDPRYAGMSLDAKVAYTFLLNRFQLSRRNGWVNDFGEVFVIFPRKELARELRICEQRVTAAFRTLKELNLIWEKRCGRGDANQIYLATVVPQDDPDYTSAPFVDPDDGASRNADSEVLDGSDFPTPSQEPQDQGAKNRKDCASKTAESEVPEPRKRRPSYKDLSHTYPSHTDVSPSVPRTRTDGRTGKRSSWAFWMPVSSSVSPAKPPGCLRTPLSGFSIRTASGLETPLSPGAGSAPGCIC